MTGTSRDDATGNISSLTVKLGLIVALAALPVNLSLRRGGRIGMDGSEGYTLCDQGATR